jgi:hypothetical protein
VRKLFLSVGSATEILSDQAARPPTAHDNPNRGKNHDDTHPHPIHPHPAHPPRARRGSRWAVAHRPSRPRPSPALGDLLGEAEREEIARQERERAAMRLPAGLD